MKAPPIPKDGGEDWFLTPLSPRPGSRGIVKQGAWSGGVGDRTLAVLLAKQTSAPNTHPLSCTGRFRTCYPVINSHPLYQLSYRAKRSLPLGARRSFFRTRPCTSPVVFGHETGLDAVLRQLALVWRASSRSEHWSPSTNPRTRQRLNEAAGGNSETT